MFPYLNFVFPVFPPSVEQHMSHLSHTQGGYGYVRFHLDSRYAHADVDMDPSANRTITVTLVQFRAELLCRQSARH